MRGMMTFGLALLLSLASCDAYLQFAEIQTPMETRIDPWLGPTYIGNKRISRFNEGFYLGEANVYGYMGPAVPPRRQDDERRVLLLGDSFVLGHTVLPRHHFARRLEQSLGESTRRTVHVLNFGKADFGLANMYAYYCDFASAFDHDRALFFVEEEDLDPEDDPFISEVYPVVRLEKDSLVIDRRFRQSSTYRMYQVLEPLMTRSAVLRLAFNVRKIAARGELGAVLFGRFASRPAAGGASVVAGFGPSQPAASLSPLSRAILSALSRDPRNAVVTRGPVSPTLRHELELCGLPVIDLGSALQEWEAEGPSPYFWPVTGMNGHWNHAAQQKIADFLASELGSGRLGIDAGPRRGEH